MVANKESQPFNEKGDYVMPDEIKIYGTRNMAENMLQKVIYSTKDVATHNDTEHYKTSLQTTNFESQTTLVKSPAIK